MTEEEIEREAQRLIASGYCPVSNKFRMLSRLDRPDWLEHMAFKQTGGFPGDPAKNQEDGLRWARGLGPGAADFYRRVHSKDVLDYVPDAVFRKVKQAMSSHGWGVAQEFLEKQN